MSDAPLFFLVLCVAVTLGFPSATYTYEAGRLRGRAEATCYAASMSYVTVTSDGKTAVCGDVERRALPIPQPPAMEPK